MFNIFFRTYTECEIEKYLQLCDELKKIIRINIELRELILEPHFQEEKTDIWYDFCSGKVMRLTLISGKYIFLNKKYF